MISANISIQRVGNHMPMKISIAIIAEDIFGGIVN